MGKQLISWAPEVHGHLPCYTPTLDIFSVATSPTSASLNDIAITGNTIVEDAQGNEYICLERGSVLVPAPLSIFILQRYSVVTNSRFVVSAPRLVSLVYTF